MIYYLIIARNNAIKEIRSFSTEEERAQDFRDTCALFGKKLKDDESNIHTHVHLSYGYSIQLFNQMSDLEMINSVFNFI